jgi:dihydroxyacetone kinase
VGKAKKFINNAKLLVTQALEGMVAASGGAIYRINQANVIVRSDLQAEKVGNVERFSLK